MYEMIDKKNYRDNVKRQRFMPLQSFRFTFLADLIFLRCGFVSQLSNRYKIERAKDMIINNINILYANNNSK